MCDQCCGRRKLLERNTIVVWAATAALAGLVVSWLVPAPADKVVFLDVGQGDAILLQHGTAQVLLDGGPGNAVLEKLAEEMPWFDRRIEAIMLSHPQRDHLEGLLHVLARYEVGLVVFPAVVYESQLYHEWLKQLQERNILIRFSTPGQRLSLGELQLQTLGPLALDVKDVNDASTVVRVDFTPSDSPSLEGESLSFLLTGDAERGAENKLVEYYHPLRTSPSPEGEEFSVLDVDVLKAGHHGSNTSTHAALLRAASPSGVVISVGKDNSYGHPDPKVLHRIAGMQVWRTDEAGSVRFERVGGTWLVSS